MDKDGELSRYYLGTAQVRLQNLCYSSSSTETDDCTGCCISDLEHNLPVLITLSEYHESLSSSSVSEHTLYQIGPPPKLSLPSSLELPCLHGRFRLECARKVDAHETDNWWSVDLYIADAPTATITLLRQYYKQHSALSDGEKYLHIRYYGREKNATEATKWRRLVGAQIKNLNQLQRNGWLCEALDKLEPFRSLWANFQISSFPHIFSWRCSQEIEHYLVRMQQMWHTITDGNAFWCDRNTVEKLEGLAPRWSSRDRSTVEVFFNTGQIFSRVNNPTVRAQILQRILRVDGFVLTFRTFFKHVKILSPVMLRLRELFPPGDLFPSQDLFEPAQRRPLSIKDILKKYYHGPALNPSHCLLQYSENDERYIETSEPAVYSYWQLCLSLLRYEHGTWKPSNKRRGRQEILDHPEWTIRLGQLARRLGFESDNILALCHQDPDLSQIRLNMREERPSSRYSVSLEKFEAEARLRQQGQEIFRHRSAFPTPLMTTDCDTSKAVPRTHQGLYLPTIWCALAQEARYSLTDFGKLLLVLTSFFGDFEPCYTSLDSEVPRTGSLPSYTHNLENGTEEGPANPSLRSSSIYSLPDRPQAQETALHDSVSYSIPAYPAPSDEPSLQSNGENMVFWKLPADEYTMPTVKYTCKEIESEIKQVVKKIIADGIAPSFCMVDSAGRLKLCPSDVLHRRRTQSKRPHDIYYAYGIDTIKKWITRELT